MSTLPAAGPRIRKIPEGDDRPRLVCADCGYVAYENPKIVVGAVCTFEDRYLLCRRAIEPRRGYWTVPSGYMELNETVEAGTHREIWEEAGARVRFDGLLAVYSLPHISQVHFVFRGVMEKADFAPGIESLEVALFSWDQIPWDDLAYPTTRWALTQHHAQHGQVNFAPLGVPDDAVLGDAT